VVAALRGLFLPREVTGEVTSDLVREREMDVEVNSVLTTHDASAASFLEI